MNQKHVQAFALNAEIVRWLNQYSVMERVSMSYIVRELLIWLKSNVDQKALD